VLNGTVWWGTGITIPMVRSAIPIRPMWLRARASPVAAGRQSPRGRIGQEVAEVGRWPAEVEPAVAALRRYCDEIGRDSAEIEWSVGVEPDDLDRFVAEDASTYVAMGFTQFTLGFTGPAWPVDRGAGFLRWRDEMNAERRAA